MNLRIETDVKFGRIETKLDKIGKYIQNLTITAMISIGGIATAVIAFVYSIVNKGS